MIGRMSGKSQAAIKLVVFGLLLQAALVTGEPVPALAEHTTNPTNVTIAGSLQSEAGCSGDWDPACAATHLTYDTNDTVWQGNLSIPAGSYEYKAALNNGWTENYGQNAAFNGANIPLNLASATSVKFYYSHQTHWITSNKNSVIATVPGSFQSELGCSGDWDPSCLRSWLQDPDGDGTYSFETTSISAGSYESKVAINEGWDENYGAGGAPGGSNIPFTVPAGGATVTFSYNSTSHVLTISVVPLVRVPSQDNNVEYNGLGHNSQDLVYRQPFGATNPGTPITLRFRTFSNDVTGVTARFYDTTTGTEFFRAMQPAATGESCMDPMFVTNTCDFWQTVYTPTQLSTLYYRFIINDGTATAYYADDRFKDGGWGEATPNVVDNSYAITIFDPAFKVIPWMKDAVIYQIFPDRFRNGRKDNDPTGTEPRYRYPTNTEDQIILKEWGDLPEGYCRDYTNPTTPCAEGPRGRDYFGGDLKGVTQRLNYLEALGVTALWFNPIFDAGSNHAYDTQDYYKIDPFFGTQKDWEELEKQAAKHGIRIILDGVFNHVSSDSKYFDRYGHFASVGACESVNSPYRSWFTFRPDANGPCAGPSGPNTMNYDAWFGFDSLPVLNKHNEDVQALFYGATNVEGKQAVGQYWLNQGADGWRLDVMGDGSFPDEFWQEFRTVVKATKPDAPIIGELWKKDEILPKIRGDMADTTMNYRFRNAILGFFGRVDNKGFVDDGQSNQPPSLFARKLNSLREDYPDATYYTLMNIMDSHDTKRILWSLTPGENNREQKEFNAVNLALGKARLKVATTVQYTIPGAPTVYYGDEVGLNGADDPDDRRTFPWNGDGQYGSGGDQALLTHYQTLAKIREANPVLRDGALRFLLTDDTNRTMAYGMRTAGSQAIIAVNRNETGAQTLTIPLSGYLRNGVVFTNALGGTGATSAGGSLQITLPALGAAILIANPRQDLTPTAPPTGLTAIAGDRQVSLQWTAVAGAAGYRVYRSPLSGGGFTFVGQTTSTTYTDTNLANGKRYYYVVTALDPAGNESGWSNQASAVPYTPIGWAGNLWWKSINMTLNALASQTVYAQVWVPGLTNAPGQGAGILAQFAYGPAGSDPGAWNWVPMQYNSGYGGADNDEYMVTFTPEQAGTFQYLARFSTNLGESWTYAYTSDGERGLLQVNSSPDTAAPAAPANPRIGFTSASSIVIEWNANTEPDLYRYEVWRSSTNGGPYTKIAGVPAGTTQYTDNTVTTNATYYYVITAQDTSFNRSANSAQVTAQAVPRVVAVTFTVMLPASTPADAQVYIAGSFPAPYPEWNPSGLQMTRTGNTASITLNLTEGTTVKYKYTLGSWERVEKGLACEELADREVTIVYGAGGTQTVNNTVANWRGLGGCPQ